MYLSFSKVSRLIISVGLIGGSAFACTSKEGSKPSAETSSKASLVADATAQVPGASVVTPTGSATSDALLKGLTAAKGAATNVKEGESFNAYLPKTKEPQLKIEAKLGYKVNENYPHRAMFKVGGQTVEGEIVKEKHRLTFSSAKADVSKLGTSVEVSFSICNDQMCKLYNETYQW